MIEKEKQDICKNELYEACSKLQCELGTYADWMHRLLVLSYHCLDPNTVLYLNNYKRKEVITYAQNERQQKPS